jgi:hypothetical protein
MVKGGGHREMASDVGPCVDRHTVRHPPDRLFVRTTHPPDDDTSKQGTRAKETEEDTTQRENENPQEIYQRTPIRRIRTPAIAPPVTERRTHRTTTIDTRNTVPCNPHIDAR